LSYTIKIKQFEGPFELLLFFIERDELDINDIPISKITGDFLDYIQHLDELNLDVASEFIVVAANLMRIKAKMLLPRKDMDDEGNEIDPREELVNKLIEYKKYKELIVDIRQLEHDRSLVFERGNVDKELALFKADMDEEAELEEISLFKLLKSFMSVLDKYEDRQQTTTHHIYRYPYTIKDQSNYVLKKLESQAKASFEDFFTGLDNRIHAVVTFLAILELLNQQTIMIRQGLGMNNFWLEKVNKT
jgi:segregation and condensation protein A